MIKKFLFSLCCIMLVVGFFVSVVYSQLTRVFELVRKENELTATIQNEKIRQEELNKQANYYETDEFIEQIAREQLGFIMHDEVVFIRE